MSMNFKPEDRIVCFKAEDEEMGRHIQKVLEPHLEEMILFTYQNGAKPLEKMPPELMAAEKFKFSKITRGDFDESYLRAQGRIAQRLAHSIDFFDYMFGYHAYATALVTTLINNIPKKFENQRDRYVKLVLRAVFTDAAVTLYHFFNVANEDAAKKREDLATAFDSDVRASFEQMQSAIQSVAGIVTQLVDETRKVRAAVSNNGSAPDQVQANVQSVAAAAEELSSTIRDISSRVDANSDSIESIARNVQAVVQTNDQLLEVTDEISKVTGLINGIASQTNLLALNATIEAARAGDAGRGFAIVAAEVKKLAQDTSNATEKIAGNITQLQETVAQISQALQDVSENVGEVSEGAVHISQAVRQQEESSAEIAGNAERSSIAVMELAENAAMTDQVAMESERLAGQTTHLIDDTTAQVKRLDTAMTKFLGALREAS